MMRWQCPLARQRAHQGSTGEAVSGLPRSQGEGKDAELIRGSQMNFGAPATSRAPDGLATVFFVRLCHRDAP